MPFIACQFCGYEVMPGVKTCSQCGNSTSLKPVVTKPNTNPLPPRAVEVSLTDSVRIQRFNGQPGFILEATTLSGILEALLWLEKQPPDASPSILIHRSKLDGGLFRTTLSIDGIAPVPAIYCSGPYCSLAKQGLQVAGIPTTPLPPSDK